jgi:hypothetical protein
LGRPENQNQEDGIYDIVVKDFSALQYYVVMLKSFKEHILPFYEA